MSKEPETIRVAVRVRPPLPHETAQGATFQKLRVDLESKLVK